MSAPLGSAGSSAPTGADAQDRVIHAGRRNRGRLLRSMASALGLDDHIDIVCDHMAADDEPYEERKLAIIHVDTVTNTIVAHRHGELQSDTEVRSGDRCVYFAGTVDGSRSEGATHFILHSNC